MSGSLVLIASYPKSGNTWTRIVFERLVRGPNTPLNELTDSFHGIARRMLFDEIAPVNAADLLEEEVEDFTPGVFRELISDIDGRAFVKVHESAHRTRSGEWLYPTDCVSAVVYLVRHPYDVAVSSSHHFAIPLDTAVEAMSNDRTLARAFTRLPESLPQYFGSWSENVTSWLDNPAYPVVLARYEDLRAEPVGQFRRLAEAVGLAVTDEGVKAVVEASRFERLQAEERAEGFRERSPRGDAAFFREGRTGSWKGVLDVTLRERIARDHGAVMERLGYGVDGETSALPDEMRNRGSIASNA